MTTWPLKITQHYVFASIWKFSCCTSSCICRSRLFLCLPCLVLFLSSVPSGRAFYDSCRSRPTLYRAEHHSPRTGWSGLVHLNHLGLCVLVLFFFWREVAMILSEPLLVFPLHLTVSHIALLSLTFRPHPHPTQEQDLPSSRPASPLFCCLAQIGFLLALHSSSLPTHHKQCVASSAPWPPRPSAPQACLRCLLKL